MLLAPDLWVRCSGFCETNYLELSLQSNFVPSAYVCGFFFNLFFFSIFLSFQNVPCFMASGQRRKNHASRPLLWTESSFSALWNLLFLVTLALRFEAFEVFFKGKHIQGKGNIPVLWKNKWRSKKGPSNFEKITSLATLHLGFLMNKMRVDLLFKTHCSSKIFKSKFARSKLDNWVFKMRDFHSHPFLLISLLVTPQRPARS